jgi:hypothetical protein
MASLSISFLRDLAGELEISLPALRAVIEIESSGEPFLPVPAYTPNGAEVSGYPVIRLEGHVFYRQLLNLGDSALNPDSLLKKDPDYKDIIQKTSTSLYQKGELTAWDQLFKARTISVDAANRSCSWGAFQVMGFNAEAVGYKSTAEFVEDMNTLEGQTRAFIGYVSKAAPACLKALRTLSWAAFAQLYNGPGYAANKYDVKLAAAYAGYAKQP